MTKHVIGDVTFTTHNNREELWFANVSRQINNVCSYIQNPDTLQKDLELSKKEVHALIKTYISRIHGELSAAFWLDIIKFSIHLYSEDDVIRHFM